MTNDKSFYIKKGEQYVHKLVGEDDDIPIFFLGKDHALKMDYETALKIKMKTNAEMVDVNKPF